MLAGASITIDPGPARLEYRLALDIAGAALADTWRPDEPALLLASAPVFVQETLARASGPIVVAADSAAVHELAQSLARGAETGGGGAICLAPPALRGQGPAQFRAAIWAAPRPSTWRRWLMHLDGALADRALLAVLVAGRGATILGPLRARWSPGEPTWPATELRRELAMLGYRIEYTYGFGGLASLGWAASSRLAGHAGRPELQDRIEASYRATLAEPTPRRLSLLNLLIVRKGCPA